MEGNDEHFKLQGSQDNIHPQRFAAVLLGGLGKGVNFLCLIKHHAMKTYGGEVIAPRIHNLEMRWRRLASLIPRPPYPVEITPLQTE
jgi:hypothetical protein